MATKNQLVKGIVNGKRWRLDQVLKSIENLIKSFNHPLFKEHYQKNPPDILFGLLRRGLIFEDATRSMDRKHQKRQEEARWQLENYNRRRTLELEQQKATPKPQEKEIENPWLIVRSYMQPTNNTKTEDSLRWKMQLEKVMAKRRL
jgi:hypothetical protein